MISIELLSYVTDADLHTKMDGIEHSTNLREIVTVGYMIEQNEKAASARTLTAPAEALI